MYFIVKYTCIIFLSMILLKYRERETSRKDIYIACGYLANTRSYYKKIQYIYYRIITKYMEKTILYIQAIGWNKKEVANWSYRYYNFTFITNNIELLQYNGIYADTFGSVENVISQLREYSRSSENKKLDLIIDYQMSDIKLPLQKMQKLCSDDVKLEKLLETLKNNL